MSFYQYNDDNVSSDDIGSSDSSDSDSDTSELTNASKTEGNAKAPMVPKFTEYTEDYFLVSNSKDRNYKNSETTFNYNLVFGTNSNINSVDNGTENAYFSKNYNNIQSISVDGVLLPNLYLDVQELHGLKLDIANFGVRLKKIRDLDYVTMNIDGYDSNVDGTNKVISSASNVLIVDDTKERVNNSGTTNNQLAESIVVGEGKNVVIGTNKSLLYMKNITEWSKDFINQVASLNNIKVSFFDPFGNELLLQNDFLSLTSVKIHSDGYIILTISNYFSPEEYSIGDTIIIRTAKISTSGFGALENFLNRVEGHNIFQLGGANNEMYNEIHIASKYSVNLSTGAISKNTYGLTVSATPFSTGTALSLNNQNSIFFKFTILKRKANFTSDLI
jgi:hypothetical protein